MSDFDREAEREKLREKYERDKRDRKSTQRMSDLLLRGATMTNRHCGTCGDPIFRHQGRAFCPSCETEVATDGESTSDADEAEPTVEVQDGNSAPPAERSHTGPTTTTPMGETGAHATLLATIERLARLAGETDDPRRARELLEAAELAAQTYERLS